MGVVVWITQLIGNSVQEQVPTLCIEVHYQRLENIKSGTHQECTHISHGLSMRGCSRLQLLNSLNKFQNDF